MFKDIDIHLNYPFCACKQHEWSWRLSVTEENLVNLHIICKSCKEVLEVPYKLLRARVICDHMNDPDNQPIKKSKKRKNHLRLIK